jgi:hypothetical protein
MRRLHRAALVSALVLGVAACSTDKTGTGAAPTAAAPPPAPGAGIPASAPPSGGSAPASASPSNQSGDAALSGDTEAICGQAAKVSGQFGAQFAQDLKLLIAAESAEGTDVKSQVLQKTTRDVENYSSALSGLSKLAADPTLKRALADMSKQVTALKGDVRKLDDRKLAGLRTTLDSACGR